MAGFGEFALLLAVGAAAWALVSGVQSVRDGRRDLGRSAQGALFAAALSLTAACAALVVALVGRDFSVIYVVEYTSRSMSLPYTLGAFWAGQAGSLLLWAWLVAVCGFVALRLPARPAGFDPVARSYVTVTISAVVLLFAALVAFAANPFDRLPTAMPDGQGLNLLLRNYGQLVHPVALYLGMVGLTVPFALCVAGLATPLADEAWLVPARRWTMWSWVFLTAGIVLGMQWSYVELGWGGYWAWDPVENASLLPWLTATAFLHSAALQQHKGALRVWNPVLVITTFVLSILGTFLTRSGVVSSVHAFGESTVGPFLLGGVLAAVVIGGGLLARRMPALRGGPRLSLTWSAEGSVLLGNALLAAMAAVVLWGTLFPLTSKAINGVESSVGAGFYQAVVTPMALVLLAAAGAYPVLRRWRLGHTGAVPAAAVRAVVGGLLAFGVATALDHGRHVAVTAVVGLAAAVATAVADPLVAAVVRSRSISAQQRPGRRAIGAALVHIGLALFIAAIAVNVGLRQHDRANIRAGESMTIGGYVISLDDVRVVTRGEQQATVAAMSVVDSEGRSLGVLTSEQVVTRTQPQAVTEVAIRSTLGEDLYLALEGATPADRSATIGAYVNPAVVWIWVGGFLIVGGGAIAAWPVHVMPGVRGRRSPSGQTPRESRRSQVGQRGR